MDSLAKQLSKTAQCKHSTPASMMDRRLKLAHIGDAAMQMYKTGPILIRSEDECRQRAAHTSFVGANTVQVVSGSFSTSVKLAAAKAWFSRDTSGVALTIS